MLRLLCLLASTVLTIPLFSQGTLGKTRIGINGSANYTYRILNNQNNDDEMTDDIIRHLDEFENPDLGFSAGISFDTNLSKRWKLEIGFTVSDQSYTYYISDQALTFGDQVDTRRGFTIEPGTPLRSYENQRTFRYVGAPVGAVYRIGFEKVKFVGNLGVMPQFLIEARNDRTVTYPDGSQEKSADDNTEQFENFNISPYVGFGLELSVSQAVALRLQPIVRYGIIELEDQSPWSTNLYSSEFNIALYYSLSN
jgi:hypothetical protein